MGFSNYDRDSLIKNLGQYDDEPDTSSDLFNYSNYSTQITSFLVDERTPTPYVIALDGEWGSGKTSLIKRVYTNLIDMKLEKNIEVVWFDAWAYERLDPAPSLMYTIAQEFGTRGNEFKDIVKKLIPIFNVIPSVLSAAVGVPIPPIKITEILEGFQKNRKNNTPAFNLTLELEKMIADNIRLNKTIP
jgi:predicted KAP-like P-loop ATPase